MRVVPLIKYTGDQDSEVSSVKSGKPQISYLGKTYGKKSSHGSTDQDLQAHTRLYQQAIEKMTVKREMQVCVSSQSVMISNKY